MIRRAARRSPELFEPELRAFARTSRGYPAVFVADLGETNMLAYILPLLLSQATVTAEKRDEVLAAMAKELHCDKPTEKKKSKCVVTAGFPSASAPTIAGGAHGYVGVTWLIRETKGKQVWSKPVGDALVLKKDSLGIWGAEGKLLPESPEDEKKLSALQAGVLAEVEGKQKSVSVPADIQQLLRMFSSRAENHWRVEKNGLTLDKLPAVEIRSSGEFLIMAGPAADGGVAVSVFVPVPLD